MMTEAEQNELEALRKEAQINRGLLARYRIRLDMLCETLAGNYESCWPSNEHECEIYDAVVALRAENERLRDEVLRS